MISFWERLIDFIAPRACPVCGRRLATQEHVCCLSCQLELPRTRFGEDFTHNLLAQMFWGLLPVERATALYYYSSHGKLARIIEAFKYNNQPQLACQLGRLMASELLPLRFFEGVDLIVPVPLTPERERKRGYNQSLQLAKGISELTHIPINSRSLRRKAFGKSQTRLDRMQRNANTEDAFILEKPQQIAGRHILLIDDVATTGATLRACGEQLMAADDVRLSILTLAITKEA